MKVRSKKKLAKIKVKGIGRLADLAKRDDFIRPPQDLEVAHGTSPQDMTIHESGPRPVVSRGHRFSRDGSRLTTPVEIKSSCSTHRLESFVRAFFRTGLRFILTPNGFLSR